MFGMAGGSAGQFAVGPLISGGVSWQTFFIGMGIAGILIGVYSMVAASERRNCKATGRWYEECT